jgi:hypothetical protein
MSATKRWRLVSVVQRAGEHGLPGEAVVAEEAAVTEAIHAAAHPGRTRAQEAETGDGADGTDGASANASTDDTAETEGEAQESVS